MKNNRFDFPIYFKPGVRNRPARLFDSAPKSNTKVWNNAQILQHEVNEDRGELNTIDLSIGIISFLGQLVIKKSVD